MVKFSGATAKVLRRPSIRALSVSKSYLAFAEILQSSFFAFGLLLVMGTFTLQLAGVDPRTVRQLDEGAFLSQATLGTIYLVATMILFRTGILLPMLMRTWPIFLLPVLAIVSAAWSPDPLLTLRRAFALLGTVLFSLSLASVYSFQPCLRLILRVLVIAILLSVVWALLFPQFGIHQANDAVEPIHAGKWRGIFAHKNTLGWFAGFTLASLILYGRLAFGSLLIRLFAFSMAAICLVAAQSGTGFALAFILTVLGFAMSRIASAPPNLRGILVVCCLMILIFISFFADEVEGIALDLLGKDRDLTGRTLYWSYILPFMEGHWALGYGYFSGFLSLGATIGTITKANFGSTHNGFLDVLVSFGLVGAVITGGYLLWILVRSLGFTLSRHGQLGVESTFPFCATVCTILHNLVESSILAGNSLFPLLLAISASMLARSDVFANAQKGAVHWRTGPTSI